MLRKFPVIVGGQRTPRMFAQRMTPISELLANLRKRNITHYRISQNSGGYYTVAWLTDSEDVADIAASCEVPLPCMSRSEFLEQLRTKSQLRYGNSERYLHIRKFTTAEYLLLTVSIGFVALGAARIFVILLELAFS